MSENGQNCSPTLQSMHKNDQMNVPPTPLLHRRSIGLGKAGKVVVHRSQITVQISFESELLMQMNLERLLSSDKLQESGID
jgi:hypothetical protein